jgi:hypothetical protein
MCLLSIPQTHMGMKEIPNSVIKLPHDNSRRQTNSS